MTKEQAKLVSVKVKECAQCRTEYPAREFTYNSHYSNNIGSYCNKCEKLRGKRRRDREYTWCGLKNDIVG